jgi:antitoxin CptB
MPQETRDRLRWRCRRGLLELELLLGAFLETAYPILSVEEQEAFEVLLSCPDSELWQYCFGETVPPDPLQADIIVRIRHSFLS